MVDLHYKSARSMSGEGKRSDANRPKPPRPSRDTAGRLHRLTSRMDALELRSSCRMRDPDGAVIDDMEGKP